MVTSADRPAGFYVPSRPSVGAERLEAATGSLRSVSEGLEREAAQLKQAASRGMAPDVAFAPMCLKRGETLAAATQVLSQWAPGVASEPEFVARAVKLGTFAGQGGMLQEAGTPLGEGWATSLEEVAAVVEEARQKAQSALDEGITAEVPPPPTVEQAEQAVDLFATATRDLWKRSVKLEVYQPMGYFPAENWETDLAKSGRQIATASNTFARALPEHLQDVPAALLHDAVDLGRLAGRLRYMNLVKIPFGESWTTALEPIVERVSTARDLMLVGHFGGAGTDEVVQWNPPA